MRGWGLIEILRDLLPPALIPVFAVLTHLGDVVTFFAVLTFLYWFGDRRKGAYALGVLLGGLSLTVGLKAFFALPRPPVELQTPIGGYPTGFGFPSGHALGSTVAWGVLAATHDAWTRQRRFVLAALAVGLVSFSRVAIGVHYAVDVIAGVVVGLLYLGIVLWASDDPRDAFLIAFALSIVAVVLSVGSVAGTSDLTCLGTWCTSRDAVSLFGATTGTGLAWSRFDVSDDWPSHRAAVATVAVSVPVLGGIWLAGYTLSVSLVVTLLASVVAFAGVLLVPTVSQFVGDRRGAER